MRVLDEQEIMKMKLENEKKRLDTWGKELKSQETRTERERQKLEEEKKKNDMRNSLLQLASEEQTKSVENVRMLVEEHKREKEEALAKLYELHKNLNDKQKLEIEIVELKGKLEVMKHMGGDDDAAVQQKINEMNEQLLEKKERLDNFLDLNQLLITKERQSNDELQEARKELMRGDMLSNRRASIGIKRMGELDEEAFKEACKQRYSPGEAEMKVVELCSLWQEKLKNPAWHPFRVVKVSKGNAQNVVKGDDELLVQLKEEWGNGVYDAVATALNEIQEYNASGCYVVPELWNVVENRKATLKEVIHFIFNRFKTLKRKRT